MTTERIPLPRLSERTLQTYAADWALFTDWCNAAGEQELPALPDTVVDFLADCPVAPATQRGRVAAIDHHHTRAGLPRPGESPIVLATLSRPVPVVAGGPAERLAGVELALRLLPTHGWTQGMFGRRDRCLLVLSQLAGVPYQHLATLAVGDINIADGIATVTSPAGAWTVTPDDNPILCGSCAVVRWLRIVDVAVTKINTAVIAD